MNLILKINLYIRTKGQQNLFNYLVTFVYKSVKRIARYENIWEFKNIRKLQKLYDFYELLKLQAANIVTIKKKDKFGKKKIND